MATRVLVVEDNPDNLYVMDRILRHAGHTVTQAISGEAALRLMADSTFDLILMDMQMPGLDGYATVRAIRSYPTGVHVPIIAVTASSMPGDRERTLAAGCNDYVAKPIDTRMLLEVVAQYLGGANRGKNSDR